MNSGQKGSLRDGPQVLVRELQRRFTLTGQDRQRIERSEDPERLDAALDAVVLAEVDIASQGETVRSARTGEWYVSIIRCYTGLR
jgi:hypothetical protein